MRKIIVFNLVSVDGFFAGPKGEIDWFNADEEFQNFSTENARSKSSDMLIFGRVTYELMARYWPTPDALKNDPVVAGFMNSVQKIVFSRALKNVKEGPHWKNIKILHEIKPEDIIKLKEQEGLNILIFGSGTIVQQFANLGLIDEYQLIVNPIVLGSGKYLFKDVKKMNLKLLSTRTFKSGNILLTYRPA